MALWDGRFQKDTDKSVADFTESLTLDQRLYPYDVWGSQVHARMLARQGIIQQEDADSIESELSRIKERLDNGALSMQSHMEDIHMTIENALIEALGDVGAKVHAGRSRNDQIATDERLFLRDQVDKLSDLLSAVQTALVELADHYRDVIVPGYTHLQHAQPVSFAHHLLAYVEMFERDKQRFADARHRINLLPLGSGALAGSTLPLDRNFVAGELGFDGILENSMDAVADRDYIIEFVSALSIAATHTSRLAEDIILWASPEFGFIEIDEAFCTGSSLMPQKKNPDVAELIRGKTSRVFGGLVQILTLLKGLPLTYNRDIQEDKAGMLDALDTFTSILSVLAPMLSSTEVNRQNAHHAVQDPYLMATDLAEWLVQQGVPFREAHRQVGSFVKFCNQNRTSPDQASLEQLRACIPSATEECLKLFSAERSVQSRTTEGGTAPERVQEQLSKWKKRLQASG